MVPKNDTLANPYPIPYDFDYCGFVNASYAIPDEVLNISNVRERVYLGHPRTMDELQNALNIFKEKKESIFLYIENFSLIDAYTQKEMIRYLDQFYDLLDTKNKLRSVFIDNAVKN